MTTFTDRYEAIAEVERLQSSIIDLTSSFFDNLATGAGVSAQGISLAKIPVEGEVILLIDGEFVSSAVMDLDALNQTVSRLTASLTGITLFYDTITNPENGGDNTVDVMTGWASGKVGEIAGAKTIALLSPVLAAAGVPALAAISIGVVAGITITWAADKAFDWVAEYIDLAGLFETATDNTGWFLANLLYGDGFQWTDFLGHTPIHGDETDNILMPAYSDNLFFGYGGNDTMFGSQFEDVFEGLSGRDRVSYDLADEGVFASLASQAGYVGFAAGDVYRSVEELEGSGHNDILIGSNGAGGGFDNHLLGLDGEDILSGLSGNDSLEGGVGNDTLFGGAGADYLDGGLGFDTASYDGAASAIYIDLASNSFSGGEAEGDSLVNIEAIRGSAYDDLLFGDEQDQRLEGGAGDDDLSGGTSGHDTLVGGSGRDRFTFYGDGYATIEDYMFVRSTLHDTIDVSEFVATSFLDGQDIDSLVRLVPNAGGTAQLLQVNRDGVGSLYSWETLGQLNHSGFSAVAFNLDNDLSQADAYLSFSYALPQWQIDQQYVTVQEDDGIIQFVLTRPETDTAQTVYISTDPYFSIHGEANSGDYEDIVYLPVTFAVGQETAEFNFTIIDDNSREQEQVLGIIVQEDTADFGPLEYPDFLAWSLIHIEDNDGIRFDGDLSSYNTVTDGGLLTDSLTFTVEDTTIDHLTLDYSGLTVSDPTELTTALYLFSSPNSHSRNQINIRDTDGVLQRHTV
ncbi:hypothetical protein MWU61_19620, partial [Loktanella sp. F6476L]|uniref:Calx-beta domain-containing protein n=1 Tax=Loktanella sp. F6476L TaxID=2926405 RepID=UPI00248B1DFB